MSCQQIKYDINGKLIDTNYEYKQIRKSCQSFIGKTRANKLYVFDPETEQYIDITSTVLSSSSNSSSSSTILMNAYDTIRAGRFVQVAYPNGVVEFGPWKKLQTGTEPLDVEQVPLLIFNIYCNYALLFYYLNNDLMISTFSRLHFFIDMIDHRNSKIADPWTTEITNRYVCPLFETFLVTGFNTSTQTIEGGIYFINRVTHELSLDVFAIIMNQTSLQYTDDISLTIVELESNPLTYALVYRDGSNPLKFVRIRTIFNDNNTVAGIVAHDETDPSLVNISDSSPISFDPLVKIHTTGKGDKAKYILGGNLLVHLVISESQLYYDCTKELTDVDIVYGMTADLYTGHAIILYKSVEGPTKLTFIQYQQSPAGLTVAATTSNLPVPSGNVEQFQYIAIAYAGNQNFVLYGINRALHITYSWTFEIDIENPSFTFSENYFTTKQLMWPNADVVLTPNQQASVNYNGFGTGGYADAVIFPGIAAVDQTAGIIVHHSLPYDGNGWIGAAAEDGKEGEPILINPLGTINSQQTNLTPGDTLLMNLTTGLPYSPLDNGAMIVGQAISEQKIFIDPQLRNYY